MKSSYFFRPNEGNRNWYNYVLTLVLVLLSIGGFGGIAWQIAIALKEIPISADKGLSEEEIQHYFNLNEILTYSVFPFIIGFAALLFSSKFIHQLHPNSFITNRLNFSLPRFLFSFFSWFSITIMLMAFNYLIDGNSSLKWNFEPQSFLVLTCITLVMIPIQTGCEELIFRGYFLQFLGTRLKRGVLVILLNGISFAILHGMNPEMKLLGINAFIFYALSGCFAALITVMDDGIELAWGFHTANNVFGILIVTNDWQVFQTDALYKDVSKPEMGVGIWLLLLILYPIMVLIFSKVYKWKDWKKRLFYKADE